MGDVVYVDFRDGFEGPARCMACGHDWHHFAPVGTIEFECPQCLCNAGAWHEVTKPNGPRLSCPSCDNDLFFITILEDGEAEMCCSRCGLKGTYEKGPYEGHS